MNKTNYSVIDYIRTLDQKNDQNTTAIEYYGNHISRKSYWDYILRYRNWFYKIGLVKGEPITICMLNSPEYEFVFAALLENGCIASTVSKSFLIADINRQTINRNSSTIILSIEFLPELIKHQTFSNIKSGLKRVIFTTSNDYKNQANDFTDYSALIQSANIPDGVEIIYPGEMKKQIEKSHIVELPKCSLLDEIATYSNTGGTTGAPKCACHTHKAIISLLESHNRENFKDFNMLEHSRSLLVIPISHITSQFYALLLRRAYGANIIYNTQVFEPSALRKELIDENIDDVVLPFGLYHAITQLPFEKGQLHLNTPLCGGEPTPYLPTKKVNECFNKAGCSSIIIGTGSTEFGSGIMASYGIENRTNESGYFFPDAKGFLVDPSNSNIITKPSQRGILYASAPWQMQGYLNDEKSTKEFFNYTDANGNVFGTNNDIAEIVGEHNGQPVYKMLGRASDFIVSDNKKTFYPAISYEKGVATSVPFERGSFLFDLRDVMLNIDGVLEVQPIIIPSSVSDGEEGYPVINITMTPNASPKEILINSYKKFQSENMIVPIGIIFRTRFERSLSSDKREVISLIDTKDGYYRYENNKIYSVCLKGKEPVFAETEDEIVIYDPPKPRAVCSK